MQKFFLFLFIILLSKISYSENIVKNENENKTENKTEIKKETEIKDETSSEEDTDLEKILQENTIQHDWEKIDPFEEHNKNILSLNMFLFRKTLLPAIFFVDNVVPKKAKKGYTNFVNNLMEPRNIVVHRLNKDNKRANIAFKRFFVNTVFGMLGLINVAELRWGSKYQSKRMSIDCFFRKKHRLGRYVVIPITNQYFERTLISDTYDVLMNPIFYFTFPLNYLVYIMDKVVILGKDKTLLYRNRKYNEGVYNALRDSEIFTVLNNEECK
jgi:ABC-type transporter lipoprotein component MlaA